MQSRQSKMPIISTEILKIIDERERKVWYNAYSNEMNLYRSVIDTVKDADN